MQDLRHTRTHGKGVQQKHTDIKTAVSRALEKVLEKVSDKGKRQEPNV